MEVDNAFICLYVHIYMHIFGKFHKKTNPMVVCEKQKWRRGRGRLFNMCFIYPVNILFVQKLQCRRRGRWRRLLREISWRVFGEVTPCLEPSGPRPLLSTPSWPPAQLEQAEPASGYLWVGGSCPLPKPGSLAVKNVFLSSSSP